jgi:transglutaminase-like putative cysteine protease
MLKRVILVLLLGMAVGTGAMNDPQEQTVSIEQIAVEIERHIAEKSAVDSGFYRLTHLGSELKLQLVRIHMEYLADLGGGVQFACVDLVGTDGPVYDVDFFLRGNPGNMAVTEVTVHKVNGQPLYAWEQNAGGTWSRIPVTDATPRLLGVIHGEDAFDFTYRIRLPQLSDSASLWLPLAQSDTYQSVEIKRIDAPSEWRQIEDPTHGNKVLFLSVGPNESGKTIEIHYFVRRKEKSPYPGASSGTHRYLESERLVPNNATFRNISEEITFGKTTELMKARALYDYVIDQVRYARYGPGWGHGDAVYACDANSGNCTDFHAYFIALTRAIGIPARFAIGAAIPSERDEGGIDGYHCWAEFFADGRWWPVDISEADKNPSLASYYFGHQPANRIELSRGRDVLVDPQPSSGPINFLAYPVLEVAGKPMSAKTEFLFRRENASE